VRTVEIVEVGEHPLSAWVRYGDFGRMPCRAFTLDH
jgi:hypothetical protein